MVARLEHGINELEDGALIGGRELLDALEALQEPRGLGRERLAERLHLEKRIGRAAEGVREIDEHCTGRLGAFALVVGDHAIGDADRGAQFFYKGDCAAFVGLVCSTSGLHTSGPREAFMSKTATVRARVEPTLKEKAEGVLGELGLNATTAITLYYEQIVRRHAIPFDISLPNAATLSAMRDAETGIGVTRTQDATALLATLDSDD